MAKHKSFTYTGTKKDDIELEELLDSFFVIVSSVKFENGIHYVLVNKHRHF